MFLFYLFCLGCLGIFSCYIFLASKDTYVTNTYCTNESSNCASKLERDSFAKSRKSVRQKKLNFKKNHHFVPSKVELLRSKFQDDKFQTAALPKVESNIATFLDPTETLTAPLIKDKKTQIDKSKSFANDILSLNKVSSNQSVTFFPFF